MAHYAFLDENNIVTQVIVGVDENKLIEGLTPEEWYSNFTGQRCLRTSYNDNIRKRFAGIGFYYDDSLDAFIPPKPFDSWVLDEDTATWNPPVPMPVDENRYTWNELLQQWELVNPDPEQPTE